MALSNASSAIRTFVSRTIRLFGEPCRHTERPRLMTVRLPGGMGFVDALVVRKAQWIAAEAGETLNGVYTFDKAMQQLPGVASP